MARIITFHFSPEARVPTLNEEQCLEIRARFENVIRGYRDVVFHGVFVGEDGRGICEWDAPSVETVNEIITKADGHPPLDGAVEVRKLL